MWTMFRLVPKSIALPNVSHRQFLDVLVCFHRAHWPWEPVMSTLPGTQWDLCCVWHTCLCTRTQSGQQKSMRRHPIWRKEVCLGCQLHLIHLTNTFCGGEWCGAEATQGFESRAACYVATIFACSLPQHPISVSCRNIQRFCLPRGAAINRFPWSGFPILLSACALRLLARVTTSSVNKVELVQQQQHLHKDSYSNAWRAGGRTSLVDSQARLSRTFQVYKCSMVHNYKSSTTFHQSTRVVML